MVILIVLGFIVILLGIALWLYQRNVWRCMECNFTFRVRFSQYLAAPNLGVHQKELYCPYCKKKTECLEERSE
ncbi:hypothetical protein lbkm_3817 [Lachnospiraceae bacterium KM106-2]|nr:hypothetical protein lbkm_3817 [Lachnospiraceae bacterium KM106-2]